MTIKEKPKSAEKAGSDVRLECSPPGQLSMFKKRFQVVGPSSSVLVHVGEDVTLPASLSPVISAQRFEVRWFRDNFDSPVLLYQNHQIKPERQMQAYNGRAALFTEELQNGNVSLRLQDVRVSDGGLYTCFVDSGLWNDELHITLKVEALGGQPSISIGSTEDQQTRLECKADKWGTTPDMAWGDMNGVDLTSESSVTEQRDNERFLRVSSFIPIKQEFNMFSCLMRSKVPKPDWHSGLTVYIWTQTIPKVLRRYRHEDLLKITEYFRPCLAYLIKAKMTNILESLVSKEILTNDEAKRLHFYCSQQASSSSSGSSNGVRRPFSEVLQVFPDLLLGVAKVQLSKYPLGGGHGPSRVEILCSKPMTLL
ncbi:BT2A2 protein, partial [Polypterus senegalus]